MLSWLGGVRVVLCEACWRPYPLAKERSMRCRRAGRGVHLCQKKSCRSKKLAKVRRVERAAQ